MATDTFRRHTRACVDAALHRLFGAVAPQQHAFLHPLIRVAYARSNLLDCPPTRSGDLAQIEVLRNLLRFEHHVIRPPEEWAGAHGHPVRVVDSLVQHLMCRYPVPRFLASVWFGDEHRERIDRRSWMIAFAHGMRFRNMPLPVALTRRMEVELVGTPDHVSFDQALRRAEILGLGGTDELAAEIMATPLAERFTEPERWRVALAWLVRCGDDIDLTQVRPMIDFLRAHIATFDVRGRTFSSVMRLVTAWHRQLGLDRAPDLRWPATGWNGITIELDAREREPWSREEWSIVELTDSRALANEGRALRHCVSMYASACKSRRSTIWSLRQRVGDDDVARPVLTIEVHPSTRTIVQVRAKANARPSGWPLEVVYRWAARERLLIDARALG